MLVILLFSNLFFGAIWEEQKSGSRAAEASCKHLEMSKFYKYHAYMIYTNKGMLLDKMLCDVIPCVCPLIDRGLSTNESA
jgi:hypothetical protein